MLLIKNGRVMDPVGEDGCSARRVCWMEKRLQRLAHQGKLAARAKDAEVFDASRFD